MIETLKVRGSNLEAALNEQKTKSLWLMPTSRLSLRSSVAFDRSKPMLCKRSVQRFKSDCEGSIRPTPTMKKAQWQGPRPW